MIAGQPSPLDFFSRLVWLDGRPLLDTIELYRQHFLTTALYTAGEGGAPLYNLVLAGRGKKNWKSSDLVLAATYRFVAWHSVQGNDCNIIASDEDQANDDLALAKKLIAANPALAREIDVRAKELIRNDGRGVFKILPGRDIAGAHGKTSLFTGFDEIHTQKTHDQLEALAPDPTRTDALTWITSYDTIYNTPGVPLFDLKLLGREGADPRMLFQWYSGDLCTDPDFADLEPELRANPSMGSWPEGRAYLDQQRRRLPTHKFRRLHLNLPGAPNGAFLDQGAVLDATVRGRYSLPPQPNVKPACFVDMSGGSSDEATFAIAWKTSGKTVLALAVSQTGKPPFNPRSAVKKFAALAKEYGAHVVHGDNYAGETFKADFEAEGILYRPSPLNKTELYEELEPPLNAGEIELLDIPKLQEQLLTLVVRGARIDHQSGEHDDWANAAAGAIWAARKALTSMIISDEFLAKSRLPSSRSYSHGKLRPMHTFVGSASNLLGR